MTVSILASLVIKVSVCFRVVRNDAYRSGGANLFLMAQPFFIIIFERS